jgi:hypothetical protein
LSTFLNAQALVQHANYGEPGGGNTGQLRAKGEAADATNSIELFFYVHLGGLLPEALLAYETDQCFEQIDFQCEVRLDGETVCRDCGGEKYRLDILLKPKARDRGSVGPERSPPTLLHELTNMLHFRDNTK